jgi:uroporphyrinogen-III synthase
MQKVIAVMRPSRYIRESVSLVRSLGFDALTAPMIDFLDKKDLNFDGFVSRVLNGETDIVIFTSMNGVDFTLLKIDDQDEFTQALNNIKVVAIGPKTKKALASRGIRVSLVPKDYSSEGILSILGEVKGKVVEIARSTHGAQVLVKDLISRGAEVHETQVYEIIRPWDGRQEKLLKSTLNSMVDIFPFTSSMITRNFMAGAEEMGIKEEVVKKINTKIVAAIGRPTAETLKEFGVEPKLVSEKSTFKNLIYEIKNFLT